MKQILVSNVVKKMTYVYIPNDFASYSELEDWQDAKWLGLPHRKAQPAFFHSMEPYRDVYNVPLNWTPRFPKCHNDNVRSDAPHIKFSWGRFAESDMGLYDDNARLTDYDDFASEINMKSAAMPDDFGWLQLGDDRKLDLRKYAKSALKLLLSGSDEMAIVHYITDLLIADFESDNLPFEIPLPDAGNGRSHSGDWTDGQKSVKLAYDLAVTKLQKMAQLIVTMASKQGGKRLK